MGIEPLAPRRTLTLVGKHMGEWEPRRHPRGVSAAVGKPCYRSAER